MTLSRVGQNFVNKYFVPDMFSKKVLRPFFAEAVVPRITNSDYLGELKAGHGETIYVRKQPTTVLRDVAINDTRLWEDIIDERTSFTLSYLCAIDSKISKIDKANMDIDPMPEVVMNHKEQIKKKVDQTIIQSVYSSAKNSLDSGNAWATAGNAASDITTAEAILLTENVPSENLFLLLHPKAAAKLKLEQALWAQNAGSSESPFKGGKIGSLLSGMEVLISPYVTGAGSNGDEYDCFMGHRSAITMAIKIQDTEYFDSLQNYHMAAGVSSTLVFGFGVVHPEALVHLKVQV